VRPEADLEDDLGLSSINLAELWTGFVERYPHLDGQEQRLRGVRTVADLLAAISGAEAAAADATPASAGPAAAPPGADADAAPAPAERLPPAEAFRRQLGRQLAVDPATLTDQADLEEDLGLDLFSRKAAFETLAESQPACRLLGRELLRVRTLGELAALCAQVDPAAPVARGDAGEPVVRFVPEAAPRAASEAPLPERLLLVGEAGPVGALAPGLEEAGVQVTRLVLEADWALADGARAPRDDVDALRAGLTADGPPPDACLFLAFDQRDEAPPDAEAWRDRVDRASAGLLVLAQALDAEGKGAGRSLTVLGRSGASPAWAAARGLARSLGCEWTRARVRSVWARGPVDAARALAVLRGLEGCARNEHDLALGDEALTGRTLREAPLAPARDLAARLPRGANVLVTGGGAGITAEVAVGLARATGCRIVALGRTASDGRLPYPDLEDDAAVKRRLYQELTEAAGRPPSPAALAERWQAVARQRAIGRTRTRVEDAGGSFVYVRADAGDGAALAAAIQQVRREHGPIRGLIHGAGLTADALLARKQVGSLRRVLAPKALGAFHLRRLLADEPLRFALLFSSLSAHTGRAGQTDYAAANEVLNAVAAAWDAAAPYPVRALLWTAWSESGLATGGLMRQMERMGLGGISDAAGVELCLAEAAADKDAGPWALLTTRSTLEFAAQDAPEEALPWAGAVRGGG